MSDSSKRHRYQPISKHLFMDYGFVGVCFVGVPDDYVAVWQIQEEHFLL